MKAPIEFQPWDVIPATHKRGQGEGREVLGETFQGEPAWLPWMGTDEAPIQIVATYVQSPATTAYRHLTLYTTAAPLRTLCGLDCDHWDIGDETVSGIAAECTDCRGLFRRLLDGDDIGR